MRKALLLMYLCVGYRFPTKSCESGTTCAGEPGTHDRLFATADSIRVPFTKRSCVLIGCIACRNLSRRDPHHSGSGEYGQRRHIGKWVALTFT